MWPYMVLINVIQIWTSTFVYVQFPMNKLNNQLQIFKQDHNWWQVKLAMAPQT